MGVHFLHPSPRSLENHFSTSAVHQFLQLSNNLRLSLELQYLAITIGSSDSSNYMGLTYSSQIACGARIAGACGTGGIPTCNHTPSALRKENCQLPGGMLTLTSDTRYRGIRLIHRSQSFKLLSAIQTGIFVNRHVTNSSRNQPGGVRQTLSLRK